MRSYLRLVAQKSSPQHSQLRPPIEYIQTSQHRKKPLYFNTMSSTPLPSTTTGTNENYVQRAASIFTAAFDGDPVDRYLIDAVDRCVINAVPNPAVPGPNSACNAFSPACKAKSRPELFSWRRGTGELLLCGESGFF